MLHLEELLKQYSRELTKLMKSPLTAEAECQAATLRLETGLFLLEQDARSQSLTI